MFPIISPQATYWPLQGPVQMKVCLCSGNVVRCPLVYESKPVLGSQQEDGQDAGLITLCD